MAEPVYPVWCHRHRKTIQVLRDPREVEATQVQARLDRLRTLGYDEPTDEERARNQFVNVDMPLHLP